LPPGLTSRAYRCRSVRGSGTVGLGVRCARSGADASRPPRPLSSVPDQALRGHASKVASMVERRDARRIYCCALRSLIGPTDGHGDRVAPLDRCDSSVRVLDEGWLWPRPVPGQLEQVCDGLLRIAPR
jgi:hypothetical protein